MLFRWLERRRLARRRIFAFWDGTKTVKVDPLRALIEFEQHPEFRMDLHPERVDQGELEAIELTARATRDVLGIKPVEEGGLTIEECLAVFLQFVIFADNLKKKQSRLRTPPSATAQTLPESTERTGPYSSDSGSVSSEEKPGTPTESEPGQTQPLP